MAEYIVRVDEKRKPSGHPSDPLPCLLGNPAIEEVIRCRDCKHKDDWLDEGGQCGVDPDGFCAWAEMRES